MDKPLLLDLFCGAGGAAMGYSRAGFDVVGVDHKPQPRFPFEFVLADAMTFPLDGFDAIHASPPCQRYSWRTFNKEQHPDLIPPLRVKLQGHPVWVIENVPGAPLREPLQLCGSSFGLRVRRHRLFESSVGLTFAPPCSHGWQDDDPIFDRYDHHHWYKSGIVAVFGSGGWKGNAHWASAMDIDWMKPCEIVEAIPPAYTEYIGRQLRGNLH